MSFSLQFAATLFVWAVDVGAQASFPQTQRRELRPADSAAFYFTDMAIG